MDDAFVDGTKWEANADKYKFVWKPVKYHENISVSFFRILKEAEKNLLSLKGIEIRVNRSIQVEGVFGIENKTTDILAQEDADWKKSLQK